MLRIYIHSNIREIGDDNFAFLRSKSIIKFGIFPSRFHGILDQGQKDAEGKYTERESTEK